MIADQAQRQCRAVEQDGEQREARHGAGTLRRHRSAGERGVEQRGQQREDGRHLLGVDPQRERGHQRDAITNEAHHQPDREHDVQARDGQDVRQSRVTHRLGHVLVDRRLLARQQGRDHAAFGARQGLQNAGDDIGAQRSERAQEAVRLAALDDRGRCEGIADGAQLLVPGDPLEIEGAGRRGAGRRRQVGKHQQPVADGQPGRAPAERHAHLERHHLGRRHAIAF